MDASHVIPFPGNPLDDSYEDSVPSNLPNPFMIAFGHVSGKASHLPDGSHTFPIAVSKYVCDSTQHCVITYIHHLVLLYFECSISCHGCAGYWSMLPCVP